MSKQRLFTIFVLLASLIGCTSDAPPKQSVESRWLQQQIDIAQREPVTNPPVVFMTYLYRGQRVVYRPPYCCDIQGVVYDETGAILCHPSGGFTGNGDGRCPDFTRVATDCAVVWRDPRGKKSGRALCGAGQTDKAPLQ